MDSVKLDMDMTVIGTENVSPIFSKRVHLFTSNRLPEYEKDRNTKNSNTSVLGSAEVPLLITAR